MNTWIRKSSIGIILIAFIGVLSFGSMVLPKEVHAAHQECPFAADEQGMCPMMSLEHVEFIPTATAIIIGLFAIIFISFKKEIILILEKQKVRLDQLRRTKKISLYQDLFSQGILNPKAP